MQVKFSAHARDRMLQRNVTEDEVRDTIAKPDNEETTPKNSKLLTKNLDRRTLKVWITWPPARKNTYLVKSVAWSGEDDNGWN